MVICYGTDLPTLKRNPASNSPVVGLLFIGRLHPIKGIENLLQAMTLTKTKNKLAICGEGDPAYEARLRSYVAELGLTERVSLYGEVVDEIKELRFQNADICIVPSFKESFGAVVLESLARGVPVIAGLDTPWQRIEEMGCGFWVKNEPQTLADAIDRAAAMPLREMGLRGRAWVERDFSWSRLSGEMVRQYRLLLEGQQTKTLVGVSHHEAAEISD
jgi:glycosyltransferase involved in cell wall biosynthesis